MKKITKQQADKCVTHHYGCDCWQYKYEQLKKENKRLREGLKSIVSSNQSCGDCTLNIMTAKKLLKRSE